MDQENRNLSVPQIPPTVVVLIVGLIVGLLGGYYLSKKQPAAQTPAKNEQTTQTPTTSQQVQPAQTPPQQEQGFYGNVLSNSNGKMLVQEVLSTKQNGTRTFTVTTDAKTQFVYQKPSGSKDSSKPPFTPEIGKADQIKKDWFVFVSTLDNIATTTSVTATQVTYSEKSPFKQ